ncbi:MAG: hypothetical protein EOP42_24745 [Sphingobacteriaceae bacterium]|nr:MAG: hypothetical protein EOP42_24745 [Sphingobacteriaceae bacterium]
MGSFYVSLALIIITSAMAYIPYKYPFNNENGQVTKVARFFGCLVVLSIICGGFLAWDTWSSTTENNNTQAGLRLNIDIVSHKIDLYSKKIDSIGFKLDKTTGRLIPKYSIAKKSTTYKEKTSLSDKELSNFYSKVSKLSKYTGKDIYLDVFTYCNAPLVVNQITKYLMEKNFNLTTVTAYPDGKAMVKNVQVDTVGKYMIISIGRFNQK